MQFKNEMPRKCGNTNRSRDSDKAHLQLSGTILSNLPDFGKQNKIREDIFVRKNKEKLNRKEVKGAVICGVLVILYFILFWNLTKWDILRVIFETIMFATLTFAAGFLLIERRRIRIEEEKKNRKRRNSFRDVQIRGTIIEIPTEDPCMVELKYIVAKE